MSIKTIQNSIDLMNRSPKTNNSIDLMNRSPQTNNLKKLHKVKLYEEDKKYKIDN